MTDPLRELTSDQDNINIDNSSTSNIPVSDFRRNEARPILTEDGNKYILYYLFNIKNILF